MKKNTSNLRNKRRKGQGFTEYVIIVGLIALGVVAAVTKFQGAITRAYEKGTTTIEKKVTGEMDK